jgi:DNA replication and repair protein RecF
MIRAGESASEVHGILFQRERRIQVDLTLTRGTRNTTKRMLVNGQRPKSRAELADALSLTVFTPEGVDIVRQGPENRRLFLTNLLTDVDLTTGDVIERFSRILSQRNALLRALQGERPSSSQQGELDVWTHDFCNVSEELVTHRIRLLDDVTPLVAHYYHELAQDDARVGVAYERSWRDDLASALRNAFNDDRLRGHTTIGPQRDDIALTLDGRDTRRQASQGEQRSLALALRLAGHELVQQRRGVDPLLLLDDVFSELDPQRSDRLLNLLPTGQTLVTTASPLPSGMSPAAVIDLTRLLS